MKRALKITAICATLIIGTAFVVWVRPFAWWVFNYFWVGGGWMLVILIPVGAMAWYLRRVGALR